MHFNTHRLVFALAFGVGIHSPGINGRALTTLVEKVSKRPSHNSTSIAASLQTTTLVRGHSDRQTFHIQSDSEPRAIPGLGDGDGLGGGIGGDEPHGIGGDGPGVGGTHSPPGEGEPGVPSSAGSSSGTEIGQDPHSGESGGPGTIGSDPGGDGAPNGGGSPPGEIGEAPPPPDPPLDNPPQATVGGNPEDHPPDNPPASLPGNPDGNPSENPHGNPGVGGDHGLPSGGGEASGSGTEPPKKPPATWDELHNAGIKWLNNLQERINKGALDPDTQYPPVAKSYNVRRPYVPPNRMPMESQNLLSGEPFNLKFDQARDWRNTVIRPGDPSMGDVPWMKEAQSFEQKTIVALESFKDRDPVKALPWSEVTFQTWKLESKGQVGELQWVVRDNIVNENTVNSMKKIHENQGIPLDTTGEWTAGDSATQESWNVLCGTVNVKGVLQMLADHHNEFGNLQIVKMWTYPHFRLSPDLFPSIVIQLGKL